MLLPPPPTSVHACMCALRGAEMLIGGHHTHPVWDAGCVAWTPRGERNSWPAATSSYLLLLCTERGPVHASPQRQNEMPKSCVRGKTSAPESNSGLQQPARISQPCLSLGECNAPSPPCCWGQQHEDGPHRSVKAAIYAHSGDADEWRKYASTTHGGVGGGGAWRGRLPSACHAWCICTCIRLGRLAKGKRERGREGGTHRQHKGLAVC